MNRFDNRDGKLLSMEGREELIHTVINPMVLYWLLIYHMPMATLIKIDSLCANFFWAGKNKQIAWIRLCRSKNEGGHA